jgi:hypothetical protein
MPFWLRRPVKAFQLWKLARDLDVMHRVYAAWFADRTRYRILIATTKESDGSGI